MLASSSATPVGPGRVKLVQVLDGDGPPPVPSGQAWGEVGVCEICLHVRDVQGVHDALVTAGCESLMAPMAADVPPNGVSLDIAYVADPWGTKLEMIEWTGLWRSLPGPARAEGVNHVAFGVTDTTIESGFTACAAPDSPSPNITADSTFHFIFLLFIDPPRSCDNFRRTIATTIH